MMEQQTIRRINHGTDRSPEPMIGTERGRGQAVEV
jgi:hypothetical protein